MVFVVPHYLQHAVLCLDNFEQCQLTEHCVRKTGMDGVWAANYYSHNVDHELFTFHSSMLVKYQAHGVKPAIA